MTSTMQEASTPLARVLQQDYGIAIGLIFLFLIASWVSVMKTGSSKSPKTEKLGDGVGVGKRDERTLPLKQSRKKLRKLSKGQLDRLNKGESQDAASPPTSPETTPAASPPDMEEETSGSGEDPPVSQDETSVEEPPVCEELAASEKAVEVLVAAEEISEEAPVVEALAAAEEVSKEAAEEAAEEAKAKAAEAAKKFHDEARAEIAEAKKAVDETRAKTAEAKKELDEARAKTAEAKKAEDVAKAKAAEAAKKTEEQAKAKASETAKKAEDEAKAKAQAAAKKAEEGAKTKAAEAAKEAEEEAKAKAQAAAKKAEEGAKAKAAKAAKEVFEEAKAKAQAAAKKAEEGAKAKAAEAATKAEEEAKVKAWEAAKTKHDEAKAKAAETAKKAEEGAKTQTAEAAKKAEEEAKAKAAEAAKKAEDKAKVKAWEAAKKENESKTKTAQAAKKAREEAKAKDEEAAKKKEEEPAISQEGLAVEEPPVCEEMPASEKLVQALAVEVALLAGQQASEMALIEPEKVSEEAFAVEVAWLASASARESRPTGRQRQRQRQRELAENLSSQELCHGEKEMPAPLTLSPPPGLGFTPGPPGIFLPSDTATAGFYPGSYKSRDFVRAPVLSMGMNDFNAYAHAFVDANAYANARDATLGPPGRFDAPESKIQTPASTIRGSDAGVRRTSDILKFPSVKVDGARTSSPTLEPPLAPSHVFLSKKVELLMKCAKTHQDADAIAIFEEIKAVGGNTALQDALKRGNTLGNFALEQLAVDMFNSLVQCAGRIGQTDLIDVFLQDMTSAGIKRPLAFYESTMKVIASKKCYKQVMSIGSLLEADDLEPSPVMLSCIKDLCCGATSEQLVVILGLMRNVTQEGQSTLCASLFAVVIEATAQVNDLDLTARAIAHIKRRRVILPYQEYKRLLGMLSSDVHDDSNPMEESTMTMQERHDAGKCIPCAYVYTRGDGCRRGAACSYCHACSPEELAEAFNAKKVLMRARLKKARKDYKDKNAQKQRSLVA